MKLKVDQVKCDTTGACVAEYPKLFRFQAGNKKAEFIPERMPAQLESKCLQIIEVCPTGAISIE
jgi:ferredoxin